MLKTTIVIPPLVFHLALPCLASRLGSPFGTLYHDYHGNRGFMVIMVVMVVMVIMVIMVIMDIIVIMVIMFIMDVTDKKEGRMDGWNLSRRQDQPACHL